MHACLIAFHSTSESAAYYLILACGYMKHQFYGAGIVLILCICVNIFLFYAVVKSSMVEAVKTMLSNIRDALHEEFKLSNWVTGEDQTVVVKKLAYMRNFVGSPGQRLENDYLEKLYSKG